MRSDRPELTTSSPELAALIARIHQDLRRERRARRWQAGAPARRIAGLAALVLLMALAIGLYLSGMA